MPSSFSWYANYYSTVNNGGVGNFISITNGRTETERRKDLYFSVISSSSDYNSM